MQDPAQVVRDASAAVDKRVQRGVSQGERAADRTADQINSATEVRSHDA